MAQLVLLPGMDGTGELFTPFLAALPDHLDYQVIRYPADRFLAYPELIEFVRAQLPQGKPYLLLGESFSGPIAHAISADKPANLKAVIFVASFLQPPRGSHLAFLLPWHLLIRFTAPKWLTRKLFLGFNCDDAIIKKFWQTVKALPPELIAFRLKQIAQLSQPLKQVGIPALYLAGKKDLLVPNHHIAPFKQSCPQLTVKHIPEPHFVLQAQPKLCVEKIVQFCKSIDLKPVNKN